MEEPTLPPPLPSNRLIRFRGWILTLLGPGLSLAMAFLIYWLTAAIHGRTSGHWNGDAHFTAQAFGIFWSVFVFGLASLAGGVSLLRRGRIGPVLMTFFLLSLGAIVWYGYQILSNAHPA